MHAELHTSVMPSCLRLRQPLTQAFQSRLRHLSITLSMNASPLTQSTTMLHTPFLPQPHTS